MDLQQRTAFTQAEGDALGITWFGIDDVFIKSGAQCFRTVGASRTSAPTEKAGHVFETDAPVRYYGNVGRFSTDREYRKHADFFAALIKDVVHIPGSEEKRSTV